MQRTTEIHKDIILGKNACGKRDCTYPGLSKILVSDWSILAFCSQIFSIMTTAVSANQSPTFFIVLFI